MTPGVSGGPPPRVIGLDRPGAPAWSGSGLLTQVAVLTGRSLRALVRDPRVTVASMLAPLVMLVMFSQIFGSIVRTPAFPRGVGYVDFLVPAIMVTTAMQSALHAGIGLTQEMRNGIIARFRTLPIWPGSVLLARALADLARTAVQLLLLLGAAFTAFGFRPPGGPLGALAAWGLALVVGGGLGWMFMSVACWTRDAELMQAVAGLVALPLMFASSALVPLAALPGWLRATARFNPLTYGIDAARDLTLGRTVGSGVLVSVAGSAAVALLAAAVAVRGFRRPA